MDSPNRNRKGRYAWVEPPVYSEESWERYSQVLEADSAHDRRARRDKVVRLTMFWSGVIFVLLSIVFVKLYTMGAVEGIK